MTVAVILFLAFAGTIFFACNFLLKVVETLKIKRLIPHAPMVRPNRHLPLLCSDIRIHSRA
jgi:hypothetical protein